jgi:hypothetical protein
MQADRPPEHENGPLRQSDFFHTGIVVPDMRATMTELTWSLGVHWRPVSERALPVVIAGDARILDFCAVYTVEGPPYLELNKPIPDTIWTCNETGAVHHVGYWTEDLEGSGRYLEQAGLEKIVCDASGPRGSNVVFSYFLGTFGYVELLSTALRSRIFPAVGGDGPAVS